MKSESVCLITKLSNGTRSTDNEYRFDMVGIIPSGVFLPNRLQPRTTFALKIMNISVTEVCRRRQCQTECCSCESDRE